MPTGQHSDSEEGKVGHLPRMTSEPLYTGSQGPHDPHGAWLDAGRTVKTSQSLPYGDTIRDPHTAPMRIGGSRESRLAETRGHQNSGV